MGRRTSRRQVLRYGGIAMAAFGSGCLRLTEPAEDTGDGTGDQDASGTPTETVGYVDELPPGVSANSVSGDLVQAHKDVLSDRNFTVSSELGAEQRTVRINTTAALLDSNRWADAYVTDEQTLQRLESDGTTIFAQHDTRLPAHFRSRLSGSSFLNALVRGFDLRPSGKKTIDGQDHLILESDGVANASTIGEDLPPVQQAYAEDVHSVTNASATLTVRLDGLVKQMDLTVHYDGSRNFLVETTDIGTTAVPKPDWTETAANNPMEFTVVPTDDRQFLVLEQVAGSPLTTEDGLSFEVGIGDARSDRNEFVTSRTAETAPGDKFYLYKTKKQAGEKQRLGVSSAPDTDPYATWDLPVDIDFQIGGLRLFADREISR